MNAKLPPRPPESSLRVRLSRRAMLRNAGRLAAAAGLAAIAAFLAARRGRPAKGCPGVADCGDCPLLDRCEQPRARAARGKV